MDKTAVTPNEKTPEDITNATTTSSDVESETFKFENPVSLEQIRQIQSDFSARRNWQQFHLPRNLFIAMVGEVGEVGELLQWRSDEQCQPGLPGWTDQERKALGEELSDVLIYLIHLANRCEIDLSTAVLDKIKKNEVRYPVGKAYDSAKKYNEL